MRASKEQIQEFNSVLNGKPIQELVLWENTELKSNLKSLFTRFSNSKKALSAHWSMIFKKELNLNDLIQLPTLENLLMESYIDQEGFQEKLPFVKREKLYEIVEFPDFSKILSTTAAINFIIVEARSRGFNLNDLENFLNTGFTEELNFQIDQRSLVKIEGWENIQKFVSIVIYCDSLNNLTKVLKHSVRDMNQYFVRQGFLSSMGDTYQADIVKLKEKLPGIN